MTVDQIIKHYGSPTAAKRALGYTLQTFRNWKRDGIPKRSQAYVAWQTSGKLKADKNGAVKK